MHFGILKTDFIQELGNGIGFSFSASSRALWNGGRGHFFGAKAESVGQLMIFRRRPFMRRPRPSCGHVSVNRRRRLSIEIERGDALGRKQRQLFDRSDIGDANFFRCPLFSFSADDRMLLGQE